MEGSSRKKQGAYYTPDHVVQSLVRWVARKQSDRLLDPACGDGRFLKPHPNSVGVEQDPDAARLVHQRVPGSLMHQGDFFAWAAQTRERFECAAGNSTVHTLPKFCRSGPAGGALLLRQPWRTLLFADFFVGAVHSSCSNGPQARRKDGICRSGRNRPRALFAPFGRISSGAFQTRPRGCGAGEIVPRALGRLLAAFGVRIWRQHGATSDFVHRPF